MFEVRESVNLVQKELCVLNMGIIEVMVIIGTRHGNMFEIEELSYQKSDIRREFLARLMKHRKQK